MLYTNNLAFAKYHLTLQNQIIHYVFVFFDKGAANILSLSDVSIPPVDCSGNQ